MKMQKKKIRRYSFKEKSHLTKKKKTSENLGKMYKKSTKQLLSRYILGGRLEGNKGETWK